MRVTINGCEETLPGELSVAELLSIRKVEPVRAAVEINEHLVRRECLGETMIQNGDRIEIVTFVGGG